MVYSSGQFAKKQVLWSAVPIFYSFLIAGISVDDQMMVEMAKWHLLIYSCLAQPPEWMNSQLVHELLSSLWDLVKDFLGNYVGNWSCINTEVTADIEFHLNFSYHLHCCPSLKPHWEHKVFGKDCPCGIVAYNADKYSVSLFTLFFCTLLVPSITPLRTGKLEYCCAQWQANNMQ